VTLEDLYAGSTKRVAIRQPDPLRPNLPRRKEVDVCLTRGMRDGQTVRLCGVVDSASDAPPADVVFLLRERRHAVYARRGDDLAMEVRIGLGEAIGGYEREIRCVDGRTIVIGSPSVGRRVVVLGEEEEEEEEEEEGEEEKVVRVDDFPSALPSRQERGKEGKSNDDDDVVDEADAPTTMPVRTAKTAASYDHLPPSMIRTGDVHVLRGHGMPRGVNGGHDRYGDLYVQYVVEMPGGGGSSSSAPPPAAAAGRTANADNLLPEERVELARLLDKLEGRSSSSRGYDPSSGRGRGVVGKDDGATAVHRLEVASASDFGRPAAASPSAPGGDHRDHDEHLHMDDDDEREAGGNEAGGDLGDFFQRAFAGGRGPSTPGFRYFSSSTGAFGGGGGFGYGGHRHGGGGGGGGGEEEDHKVECNQM
jgi:hypothetical protein